MLTVKDLFDTDFTIAAELFAGRTYPWEVLADISEFIIKLGKTLSAEEFDNPAESVWVAKSAKVFPSAYIAGPCIIDEEAEIRHCAFIRGSAIVGKNCVVGNSVELKNCVLFDGVQVSHFNYVGDAVLGHKAHMGAGSITSNVRNDKAHVVIRCGDETFDTGRKKVGAFLGDFVEVGCNTVLNPGTIVGRNSGIYPVNSVRGVIPENSIYKNSKKIIKK